MSTQPLLPSYVSATRQHRRQNGYQPAGHQPAGAGEDNITSASSIIQILSFLIFAGTAILSTFWAYRSNTTSELVRFQPSPAPPFFISLHFLDSTSVGAPPTVLRFAMPHHLIQLLGWLPYIYLL
jgi:hypothetical protein